MRKFTKNLALIASTFMIGKALAQAPPTTIVKDSIFTNTHWTCETQYLLKGYVYVVSGTTLTIDSGVVIRGDKNTKGSLIIERGAKIYANGTKYSPIVMTSNQPAGARTYGDWGGLIICGKAPVNWTGGVSQVEGGPRSLYGGVDPHDNSGTVQYLRCEFAGIAFSPNNEINGITFCGVGDGTQLDHLQVSYSGDDSYEWFGGNVNSKYLIAYRGWDDDFDTDNGYSGLNQFGVGLRDPFAADQSGSKAFESDSYQAGTKTGLAGDTTGLTKCVFSNYTIVGPLVSPSSSSYDPQFVSAAHIRRGSAISIMNSVLVGYPAGILYDESSASFGSTVRNLKQLGSAGDTISQCRNNILAGFPTTSPTRKEVEYVIDGARSLTPTNVEGDTITGNPFNPFPGPFDYYFSVNAVPTVMPSRNRTYPTEQTGVRLQAPYNLVNPNFVPTSTSPIVYNNSNLPTYVKNHYTACCAESDHFHNTNKYPFNPSMPINTDTSSFFVNYNAPDAWPSYSSGRLKSSFFSKVNYIGAFAGTQTTSDAYWMTIWTNFDPVNTDYTNVCTTVSGIKQNFMETTYLQAFPNPARESVTINFSLNNSSNASIELYDFLGKRVEMVNLNNSSAGLNSTTINTKDLTEGIYFVKLTVNNYSKTIKLVVVK